MRRFLVVSMVLLLALFIAVPSFALEVKWGGLFRARVMSQEAFTAYNYSIAESTTYTTTSPSAGVYATTAATGINVNAGDDLSMFRTSRTAERSIAYTQHLNRFDQRLRMFIDFISSENLKVVTKFETNSIWGSAGASTVIGGKAYTNNTGSGNVGADSGTLNVKNVYIDFKIPQTPLVAKVGVQGINLVDSWIVDTDLSAALLAADLKPFTIVLGYVSGQNFTTTAESENIDDLAAVVSYKEGPFSASLVGLWQDAHNTPASIFPQVATLWDDPLQKDVQSAPYAYPNPWTRRIPALYGLGPGVVAENNQLFDLGFQLGYKIDYLSAYLNFVKNFGSVKLGATPTVGNQTTYSTGSTDYTGWMIDAGVNYFCGPYTLNLGGFYTTGGKTDQIANPTGGGNVLVPHDSDITWFVYPLSTSKYFSEIMGGGILDNTAPNGGYWRGYPAPTNIWTVTAGGAWQVLPQTKLALSWWYFGTSESVPSRYDTVTGSWKFDSYLGNEIDLNITQNIVDKLNLDLVGAYMFTGDAFRAKTYGASYNKDDNTYELGARLQWAW